MPEYVTEKQKQVNRLHRTIEKTETALEPEVTESYAPPKYDALNVGEQLKEQQDFYTRYKKAHKKEYRGRRILPPAPAPEIQAVEEVQKENMGIFARNRRISRAFEHQEAWKRGLGKDEEGETRYGLELTKNPDASAFDLMKGTLELSKIETKKSRESAILEEEADKKDQNYQTYLKCKDKILALAPPLRIHDRDPFTEAISYDEDSLREFRSYIKNAIKDPIGTLRTAASDAVYSYGEISPKLLSKEAIPKSFPQLKQLRDKYKAIHELRKGIDLPDELKFMPEEMEKAQTVDGNDNYAFASMVYSSIDADLRYALEHAGVKYRDDGSLVDTEIKRNHSYKSDGSLTSSVLSIVRKGQTNENKQQFSVYWDEQMATMLKPKKESFEDDYSIVQAVNGLDKIIREKNDKKQGKDDGNKAGENGDEVVKAVSEEAKILASEIHNIDVEIRKGEKLLSDPDSAQLNGRPAMKRRLKNYLERRKQQQLDLFDRVNGCINGLSNVAKGTPLSQLGEEIMRKARLRQTEEKEKKTQAMEDVMTYETNQIMFKGLDDEEEPGDKYTVEQFKERIEAVYKETAVLSDLVADYTFTGVRLEEELDLFERMEQLEKQFRGLRELCRTKVGKTKGTYEEELYKTFTPQQQKAHDDLRHEVTIRSKIVFDKLKEYRLIHMPLIKRDRMYALRKRTVRKNLLLHKEELEAFHTAQKAKEAEEAKAAEEANKKKETEEKAAKKKKSPEKPEVVKEEVKKEDKKKNDKPEQEEPEQEDPKQAVSAYQEAHLFGYNLQIADSEHIYDFDQPQDGDNGCWAASHTYVMNAYLKLHKLAVPLMKQGDFKTMENYEVHPDFAPMLEDETNKEAIQIAGNIGTFLSTDKPGNPYTVADAVIRKIPMTAERHMVFNSMKDPWLKNDPEFTRTVADHILKKVEDELMRTKVPISLLRGGHYLSIVGIDQEKKVFLTMNSLNKKKEDLNKVTEVDPVDLIGMQSFELIFPEYLDKEGMEYLRSKFKFKENLYDENGDMVMDPYLEKVKKDSLKDPENMMHCQGVDFEIPRNVKQADLDERYFKDQLYMPLKLKQSGDQKEE